MRRRRLKPVCPYRDAVPGEAGAHAQVEAGVDRPERRVEAAERLEDVAAHEHAGLGDAEAVGVVVVLALVELALVQQQAAAERGERVLHLGRDLAEDLTVDDAVRLQLPQLLGQHLLADLRELPPEGAEAPLAVDQEPDQHDLPLAPDDGERRLDVAAELVRGTGGSAHEGCPWFPEGNYVTQRCVLDSRDHAPQLAPLHRPGRGRTAATAP